MNTHPRLTNVVSARRRRTALHRLITGKDRRGNVLVLSALLLAVIFAMVSFAMDLGYIVHVETEMQRTADSCALAAAAQIPDLSNAVDMAKQVAQSNAHVEGPELKTKDVIFGWWDRDTATFADTSGSSETVVLGEETPLKDINSVKIVLRRDSARGNPLRLFFAPVIGHNNADVDVTSIALWEKSLCGPLVGIDWVDVPGNPTTDSYRSADGSYATQIHRQNGSVCSDGPISVDGGAIINGDANPGNGYATTISGNSNVTGNTTPRIKPLNLPGVDDSEIALNNDNDSLPKIQKGNSLIPMPNADGDFILDGGKTYNMPSGRYYFRNLLLTGQSTLVISGPTVIYLWGSMDTSGGYTVNSTQLPNNLKIFMTGGFAEVTASVAFYGTVYAPNTQVTLSGSAQFYGAFVGQTLYVTGTGDIHYDENLDFTGELVLPSRIALVK